MVYSCVASTSSQPNFKGTRFNPYTCNGSMASACRKVQSERQTVYLVKSHRFMVSARCLLSEPSWLWRSHSMHVFKSVYTLHFFQDTWRTRSPRIFSILNTIRMCGLIFPAFRGENRRICETRPRHGSPLLSWRPPLRLACLGIGVPTTLHLGSWKAAPAERLG